VDITVYLPDEIGTKAKEAKLNLSALLRVAVVDELEREAIVAKTLGDSTVHEMTVEDDEGRGMVDVRLHGASLAAEQDGTAAFLTEDERLVVYDDRRHQLVWLTDEEDLRQWLSGRNYVKAMAALGKKAVIDIGRVGR
jgi:hypothetical protein